MTTAQDKLEAAHAKMFRIHNALDATAEEAAMLQGLAKRAKERESRLVTALASAVAERAIAAREVDEV